MANKLTELIKTHGLEKKLTLKRIVIQIWALLIIILIIQPLISLGFQEWPD